MNLKLSTALAAVMALGQKAVALAEGVDQPAVQQLHDDALGAVQQLETDGETLAEATIEAAAAKILTPTLGAEGAAKFASVYCRAGEVAIATKLGLPTPS